MKKLLLLLPLFVITGAIFGQTIQSVSPGATQPGRNNLAVNITGAGSHFTQGSYTATATFTNGSTQISAYYIDIMSATNMIAYIDIPVNATLGEYSLAVVDDIAYPTLNNALLVANGPTVTLPAGQSSCNGSTFNLSPIITGGYPPYTYQWGPSGSFNCSTCPNPTYTVNGSDSVFLIVTDSLGLEGRGGTYFSAPPALTNDICIVSVDSVTGKNIVIWNNPNLPGIDSFIIFKETTTLNDFEEVGSVPGDSFSVFIDMTSNPLAKSDRYTLAVFDTCGHIEAQSSAHQTIHLGISPGVGNTWNLNWNPYVGFSYNTYYIYRNSGSGFQLIDNIASSSTSYTDLNPPAGTVYYQVAVINPGGCSPSRSSSPYSESRSNVISTLETGITQLNSDALNAYVHNNNGNYIHVNFDGLVNYNLRLFDISGQQVMSTINSTSSEIAVPATVTTGIYILELKSGENISHTKVFIR